MPLTTERRKELEGRGGEIYRTALKENRKLKEPEQEELRMIERELDRDEYDRTYGGEPAGRGEASRARFVAGMEKRGRERGERRGEIRTYKPGEKLSEGRGPEWGGRGLGAYVRGRVTGKWDGAEEHRTMTEGTPSAGGFLVPTPLSLQVIDLMRNQSQVVNAGAVSVPMTAATLAMARVGSDVTATWRAELAPITYSDNQIEKVMFIAKTLAAGAKISVELIEDSQNIDEVVSNSIAQALALELDRACLYGAGGAVTPLGIKNQPGVTITPVNGAPATLGWTPFSTAIAKLMSFNFRGPFGAIYSARTAGELDAMKDTLGQPLRQPDLVAGMAKFVSNQVPNNLAGGSPPGNVSSDIFVAQWDQAMIGMRTELTMEVSRVAADSASSAFTNLEVWIRAYLRADLQLAHPQAFNVLTGIM